MTERSTQFRGAMAEAFFAAEERIAKRDDIGNLKAAPVIKQIQENREKAEWWKK